MCLSLCRVDLWNGLAEDLNKAKVYIYEKKNLQYVTHGSLQMILCGSLSLHETKLHPPQPLLFP